MMIDSHENLFVQLPEMKTQFENIVTLDAEDPVDKMTAELFKKKKRWILKSAFQCLS
jgi:hypothetical protein